MSGYRRRNYRRKGKKVQYSKAKKMVQGHGPTFLEQLGSGLGAAAEVAKAVLPMVEAINTEEKYLDQSATVTAYNPGTNDQLVCLTNSISQGTDDTNRVGNSILAKDLNIRGQIVFAGADASHLYSVARMTILVWKDNAQSNAPTIAKIYEAPSNIDSHFNKDYTDQMVIIKDKRWGLNANISATQAQHVIIWKFYKKIDWHMRWLNTTTGNTTNHIYVAFRAGWSASANATSFSYYSRLNFTDN